ncbi:Deoxyguanosinetriphosphate triphosphohydrolase-like protein [Frankliniella fusca]|uniref:Deoxyguanosinetriphosphate triphosphohydrolase-like protein n=1 Tax=Frankliniella fusca TaxID=407009 RepID=A0AAE1LED2_9NEOP|nr:Deoxyguanosinetriphosphate triphosphohydrolase-like protein [Frankliniella fusca]KAK3916549.1 Deoxyguanosinetriphosphate triphosphohydrolase-like protein [Frankliniella fusca]
MRLIVKSLRRMSHRYHFIRKLTTLIVNVRLRSELNDFHRTVTTHIVRKRLKSSHFTNFLGLR